VNKPNVLIMTDKFAEVSREPIEMLVDAGLQVHEHSYNTAGSISDEKFCKLIQGMDVLVVTGSFPVSRRVIESTDCLKMIAIRSAGFDGTDLDAAGKNGIVVTHNPGANADSVADTTIGLMLAVLKKIAKLDRKIRCGGWERERTLDMHGKILGIIGLGRIGKRVVKRAQGFDMAIIANDIREYKDFSEANGIEMVSKEEILQQADIITLHTPLDESTLGMIDEKRLGRMKDTAILINTARGAIVNENALYQALSLDWIGGAGLDVHATEPPGLRVLVELENVVSTCHIAGLSDDASYAMAMQTVEKIIACLSGRIPPDVLTPRVTLPIKAALPLPE
jgi:D-3-phosphoglycerate dehydrogenase